MSQHSSFKGGSKHAKHRSVLKRSERIKALTEKGEWKEGGSVFSLPKVKVVKFKVKKEKSAAAAGDKKAEAAPAAGEKAATESVPKATGKEKKKTK